MSYIRLVKYPGSKTWAIPDVRSAYLASGKKTLIDVFGGSGLISLNVRSQRTVYNDLNHDLVNFFLCLKHFPDRIISISEALLDSLDRKYRPGNSREFNDTLRQYGPAAIRMIVKDTEENALCRPGMALETFYRYNTSFGGMGDTYGTVREKSPYRTMVKAIEDMKRSAHQIRSWEIEFLDFRQLMEKLDSRDAFFYLDPPYPGKDWYEHNFSRSDFRDLADLLSELKGAYLLTLDTRDSDLAEIFGRPAFFMTKRNHNGPEGDDGRMPRSRMFYTNVEM